MSGQPPIDDEDPYADDDFSEPVDSTPPADDPYGESQPPPPPPPDDASFAAAPGPFDAPDTPPPLPNAPAPPPRAPFVANDIAATTVQCTACGYNLTGVTIGGVCPECGMSVSDSLIMSANQSTSGMAVASMVIGIVAIFPACCIPIGGAVLPVVGLPLGLVGHTQSKSGAFTPGSKGMAVAGIALNSVALLLQGLVLVRIFLF